MQDQAEAVRRARVEELNALQERILSMGSPLRALIEAAGDIQADSRLHTVHAGVKIVVAESTLGALQIVVEMIDERLKALNPPVQVDTPIPRGGPPLTANYVPKL